MPFRLVKSCAATAMCLILSACASTQEPSFNSPDAAATALVDAIRDDDEPQLHRILGPGANEVLWSGDPVADQQRREAFIRAYDEHHRLVTSAGDRSEVTLVVGPDEWPLPIPIVQDRQGWTFDTDAGLDEMLSRRIGRNELDAIEVCRAIVDAQREYAMSDPRGDGVSEYARQFLSDPGQHNGLYWPTDPGEPPSPLGELLADAAEEGYALHPTGQPRPYHGYYYRMLTAQGPNAPGGEGAHEYVINGRMIAGFGVVAWPAAYGNSGIQTFIVNQDGIVYQRDLGEDTDRIARAMDEFDPGPQWTRVDESQRPVRARAETVLPASPLNTLDGMQPGRRGAGEGGAGVAPCLARTMDRDTSLSNPLSPASF